MPAGIATTWEVLATTANGAAVEVLLPALDSPWLAIRDHSLKLLLARRHRANGNAPAFSEPLAGNGLLPNIVLISLRCRFE